MNAMIGEYLVADHAWSYKQALSLPIHKTVTYAELTYQDLSFKHPNLRCCLYNYIRAGLVLQHDIGGGGSGQTTVKVYKSHWPPINIICIKLK